ncbi:MAG TPA: hypothetical protein VMJ93_17000 [Verrucomicrobiae bacterium]|nr:hypothetical protein [Verrucomicrobiae bacterium]
MPGGRRIGKPSSPVTAVALVVMILIIVWVLLGNLGWLPTHR